MGLRGNATHKDERHLMSVQDLQDAVRSKDLEFAQWAIFRSERRSSKK